MSLKVEWAYDGELYAKNLNGCCVPVVRVEALRTVIREMEFSGDVEGWVGFQRAKQYLLDRLEVQP